MVHPRRGGGYSLALVIRDYGLIYLQALHPSESSTWISRSPMKFPYLLDAYLLIEHIDDSRFAKIPKSFWMLVRLAAYCVFDPGSRSLHMHISLTPSYAIASDLGSGMT